MFEFYIIFIIIVLTLLGLVLYGKWYNSNLKSRLNKVELELTQKDILIAGNAKKKELLIKTADDFISKNQNLITLLETKNEEVRIEQIKNEKLLLNILPNEIIEELKKNGSVEAKLFDSSTVLFTDFKGFTSMSERLSPSALIKELNCCFSKFDEIAEKHGVEKVKTIGDAYMAVAGVPSTNINHAKCALDAAIEIQNFIFNRASDKKELGQPFFEIRIGLHSGPVIAGIVGLKKFQYDIWGDSVNIASRMESSGIVGKVNVSEATYFLLKDNPKFSFESRGELEVKGKGMMKMFYANNKLN